MSGPNKGGKRVVPQPGGEAFHEGEPAPLLYTMPMPPVKSRGRLIPADEGQLIGAGPPMSPEEDRASGARKNILLPSRALIPASEEVARLPSGARAAFAARCAARVAPLHPNATTPEAAAALILAAATVETPLKRQLLCIRRDFDRLVYLTGKHNWTDDTTVPADVFGPMWPEGRAPEWFKESKETRNPSPVPPVE